MAQQERSRTIETVYHIGDLSGEREQPTISYEGSGLSVSKHPDVWQRILRGAGDTEADGDEATYELTNESGTFYAAVPGGPPREHVLDWCLDQGYVTEREGYEVSWMLDDGHETTIYFEEREAAEREAGAIEDSELRETTVYSLGSRGEVYWREAFTQLPCEADPLVIRDMSPVWFAEAHGYDGVWWDETLAPSKFSAPRGVIFQNRLAEWTIERIASEPPTP